MALVQVTSSPLGNKSESKIDGYLPHPSLAGNCLVACIQSDTGATGFTITDDVGSNTWTLGVSISNAQRVSVYYALNTAAGTQRITATPVGVGTTTFNSLLLAEFYNVATAAAADGSNSHNGAAPNLTAGSFTPGTSGDLILNFLVDVTAAPTTVTNFAPVANGGLTPTLAIANREDGIALQYGIQASAAAINPSMTATGSTHSFNSLGLALKSAVAGTAPGATDMRIVHEQHQNVYGRSQTSVPLQFPCTGNLIVSSSIFFSNAANPTITSIADGNSNTYTEAGVESLNSGVTGIVELWYAQNATVSTNMTGPTYTLANALPISGIGDSTVVLYDIVNAHTSPFDVETKTNGTQVVTANLTTDTITPTNTSGIIFSLVGVETHAIGTSSGAGFMGDNYSFPEANGSNDTLDQSNGWAHYLNSDAASRTFIYTVLNNTAPAGVQRWASKAVAFKTAAVSTPPTTITGLGNKHQGFIYGRPYL